MLRLGAHESTAGGLYRALERATSVGCESLQIWTKSGRQWRSPPLQADEIRKFNDVRKIQALHPMVAHASYLINLASPKPDLYRRSVDALIDEIQRCEQLSLDYLILHPGAHTGSGLDAGLISASQGLAEAMDTAKGYHVRVLLETTVGQGTTLGGKFEELALLLEADAQGGGLGICLDTCHVFAAGYDLRTEETYADTMTALDRVIGLSELHIIHLNDSQHPLGSHKDRHEHIGKGHLGLAGFRHILVDQRLNGMAGILETPKSDDLHEDRENLARLRAIAEGKPDSEILLESTD